MAKNSTTASGAPFLISLLALLSSLALVALPIFKLVSNTDSIPSLVGWFLTPVVTFTMYGLDFFLQSQGGASSNFIFRPGFTKALKAIAYISLVVGIFHIWRIATLWSVVS